MKKIHLLAALATFAVAMPAQALTFFSLGGAPDPGLASFETSLVSFDAPMYAGVTQSSTGTVGVFNTTSASAAAPALDTTTYFAVGTGGSTTFDFTGYFTGKHIRSLSVYVGSVDTYNHIDILDTAGATIATINGSNLPGDNGDQGAAITNRRLYINFTAGENVGGLRFRSEGTAFEFDTIGASSAVFGRHTGLTPPTLPPSTTAVPEPAAWSMMIAGLALVGMSSRSRSRHRKSVTA